MIKFSIGIILGAIFGAIIFSSMIAEATTLLKTEHDRYKSKITECEAMLPRNKTCVLVAMPKKEREKNLIERENFL